MMFSQAQVHGAEGRRSVEPGDRVADAAPPDVPTSVVQGNLPELRRILTTSIIV